MASSAGTKRLRSRPSYQPSVSVSSADDRAGASDATPTTTARSSPVPIRTPSAPRASPPPAVEPSSLSASLQALAPQRKRGKVSPPPLLPVPSSPAPPPSSQAPPPVKSAMSGERLKQGMFKSFVTNALDQKALGNMTQYNELTAAFAIAMPSEGDEDEPGAAPSSFMASPSTLQSWLVALSEQVSKLDSSHAALVDNILLLPWTTMSESFARVWVNFVYHLVSARGEWLHPVLKRAVKTLSYRTDWRALALADLARSTASDAAGPQGMATRRLMYDRTHGLLRRLLAVVPTLAFTLEGMLRKYFPLKRDSALVQLVYIRNALRVCEYCPELSDSVLNLVIGRALQTDVEIQVELDELEDEAGAAFGSDDEEDPLDQGIDQVDTSDEEDEDDEDELEGDEQVSSDDEGGPDEDGEETDQAQSVVRVRKLVDQLDQVMKALFDHLNRRNRMLGQQANRQAYSDARDPRPALFASLLSIFNRSILPTFKSRHVQFLLFWFSSLDADYVDLFLGSLLSTALHWATAGPEAKDEPPIIRLAAASYAASFVSRAKFVNAPICRDVMTNLCAFLEGHLAEASLPDTPLFEAAPGSPAHHPFYSVSQAAFYIFCFRWRDLRTQEESYGASLPSGVGSPDVQVAFSMSSLGSAAAEGAPTARIEGEDRGGWMPALAVLTRAVTSPLNPLRFCAPAIVQQFAHVAQHSGFFYCFSILEANKRIATRDADTGPKETASIGLSDAFFPFDPFRLPKAGRYIDPLYREWDEVAPDDTDDEEADDAAGFDDDASSRSSPIAVPAPVLPKPSADWSSSLDLESMSIESH